MSEETGVLAIDGAGLAWRRNAGAGPMIVWLGGFASEMTGTKASALASWAAAGGRGFLRFDYFGHGESEGDFAAGTISRWRADAMAMIDQLARGPLVLVGSSMGGWLASLAALARPERIAGLVLIAPAIDFTRGLADASTALREDGARWSILPGPIPIACPVRILQGGADDQVPWRHALEFSQSLRGDNVVFSLIRDGDHRLSRPEDIARLIAAVEEVA
ncbi:MAG: alpha/beta hydrolase [Caulobacteraceae bacterium]